LFPLKFDAIDRFVHFHLMNDLFSHSFPCISLFLNITTPSDPRFPFGVHSSSFIVVVSWKSNVVVALSEENSIDPVLVIGILLGAILSVVCGAHALYSFCREAHEQGSSSIKMNRAFKA
jgi:hypothetical protein